MGPDLSDAGTQQLGTVGGNLIANLGKACLLCSDAMKQL